MKITTTQHIRIEFDDDSVKELSEQEAKELHSDLGKLLSKSHSEENHPIMEWSKDWKTPNVLHGGSEFLATTKDTRMELRTSSEIKNTLRSASALAGVDMTSFILSAALQKAQEMITNHNLIYLNKSSWNKLNEAIINPRQPSENLQQLMRRKTRNGSPEI